MDIKERKQLTYVILKNGRVLITEASSKDVYDHLLQHHMILIEWEVQTQRAIESVVPANLDDVESFILWLPRDKQQKLREKKLRLKANMGKEMPLSYAKNYANSL